MCRRTEEEVRPTVGIPTPYWHASSSKSKTVPKHFPLERSIFDDFFVEAPKLKVSLTDPPIFRGFVIGEASGDGRPIIGRLFEDFFIMVLAYDHQTVGR